MNGCSPKTENRGFLLTVRKDWLGREDAQLYRPKPLKFH
jgi:hypothetical protein